MTTEAQMVRIRRDRRIYKKALRDILAVRDNDNQSRCNLGRGRTIGIEDCAYYAELALARTVDEKGEK